MIKEALQYIVGLSCPSIMNVEYANGGKDTYSDKEMHILKPHYPLAASIKMHTLSSLVEYIREQDEADMDDELHFLHVQSPTEVELYSTLNENREREHLVRVTAELPEFAFDRFMDNEQFVIAVQSKFQNEGDRDLVLQFAGTVENSTIASYGDDGVTQKATVKTGIASKEDAKVPNPVILQPYRTFVEVGQPASQFIFRMKQEEYKGIQCALFEADGGAWRLEAMNNIKEYLKGQLQDMNGIVVIS